MSLESVRAFLADKAPEITIMERPESTATVAQAASGFGVAPGQIAKTLALTIGARNILVVVSGEARLDNAKAKAAFGGKVSMMPAAAVVALTGHPIGGVCPFGLATSLTVYCDITLQAFDEVLPAAGSTNSAVRIKPLHMANLVGAEWVDICR